MAATPVNRRDTKPARAAVDTTEWVRLDVATALFRRPSRSVTPFLKLGDGAKVRLMPSIPAKAGWTGVQTPKGNIGYVPSASLEGETPDWLKKHFHKKKRKRSRRRRRRR